MNEKLKQARYELIKGLQNLSLAHDESLKLCAIAAIRNEKERVIAEKYYMLKEDRKHYCDQAILLVWKYFGDSEGD